ncbi:hypothetical protein ACFL54_06035 [Planctomycetota bacterium]
MDKSILFYLIGAVIILAVIVGFAMSGGIDEKVKALLVSEGKLFEEEVQNFEKNATTIAQEMKANPKLFKDYAADWKEIQQDDKKEIQTAGEELAKARALGEKEDKDDTQALQQHLNTVRITRVKIKKDISEMLGVVKKQIELKQNRPAIVAKLKKQLDGLQKINTEKLSTKAKKAAADWPGKKKDLEGRMDNLAKERQRVEKSWDLIQAENEKSEKDINYGELGRAIDKFEQSYRALETQTKEMPLLIDQLYTSWDKILVDMEIKEGEIIEFFHTHKVLIVKIIDVEKEENRHNIEDTVTKVSEKTYKNYKDKLGMTVESKKAGTYNHEADHNVEPPGYAQMAPPTRERNHYGYWHRHGHYRSWRWHSGYGYMGRQYYGSQRHDVHDSHYRGYQSAVSSGRTYYGEETGGKKRYGSDGGHTRASYANSKYVKTDGYKNSRYTKSGGSYKGAKHERAARARARSSSRSSSRSRGGK